MIDELPLKSRRAHSVLPVMPSGIEIEKEVSLFDDDCVPFH
jgi:hypothetical protein